MKKKNNVISMINSMVGLSFFALGFVNGAVAYLPTVMAGLSKMKPGTSTPEMTWGGAFIANLAVYSGALAVPPTVLSVVRGQQQYGKRVNDGDTAKLESEAQSVWKSFTDSSGIGVSSTQKIRQHLIQFQIDVATNGPWMDKDSKVPVQANPFWDKKLGMVSKIGRIQNGQNGKQFDDWKFESGYKWSHDFIKAMIEQYPYLFESAAKSIIPENVSGGMRTLRVVKFPPGTNQSAIGLFTRETRANVQEWSGSVYGTAHLELWAIRPWLGIS